MVVVKGGTILTARRGCCYSCYSYLHPIIKVRCVCVCVPRQSMYETISIYLQRLYLVCCKG